VREEWPNMTDKKTELTATSAEAARETIPSDRETGRERPKGYRVVAVSLYTPEADWIDEVVLILQRSGNPKANRSLVVREAILRLREDLRAKDAGDILRNFTASQAKRGSAAGRASAG
jgi:hypothetical protein